eukprot:tig00020904_g15235.t1
MTAKVLFPLATGGPSGGANEVRRGPTDLLDEVLSPIIKMNSSTNTALCGECERADATIRCNDCGETYCSLCFRHVHSAPSRQSHMAAFLNASPSPPNVPQQRAAVSAEGQCSQHREERLSYFCAECREACCANCIFFGSHAGHSTVPIDQAVEEAQKMVQRQASLMMQLHKSCEATMQELDSLKQQQLQEIIFKQAEVKTKVDMLRVILEKKEKELVGAVQVHGQRKLYAIEKQVLNSRSQLQTVRDMTTAAQRILSRSGGPLDPLREAVRFESLMGALASLRSEAADTVEDLPLDRLPPFDISAQVSAIERMDLSVGGRSATSPPPPGLAAPPTVHQSPQPAASRVGSGTLPSSQAVDPEAVAKALASLGLARDSATEEAVAAVLSAQKGAALLGASPRSSADFSLAHALSQAFAPSPPDSRRPSGTSPPMYPGLRSSSLPSATGPRQVGSVKHVVGTYGFIQPDTGEGDLFYHTSQVESGVTLKKNDKVDYSVVHNMQTGKLNAIDVRLLVPAPATSPDGSSEGPSTPPPISPDLLAAHFASPQGIPSHAGAPIPVYDPLDNAQDDPHLVTTMHGHSNWINAIVANGPRLYSACSDYTIKLWDIEKFDCVTTLTGHSGFVNTLTILGEPGRLLYSGSGDKCIKIWDLETNQCLDTVTAHSSLVNTLATDQRYLYSGSSDRLVKVWDLARMEPLMTLTGHADYVTALVVSEGRLFTGSADKKIKVWDTRSGQCIHTFDAHKDWVNALVVSDQRLYSGSSDNVIKVWDLRGLQRIGKLTGHTSWVNALTVSGKRLFSGSGDSSIKVWDVDSFRNTANLVSHKGYVKSLCVAPAHGSRLLFSGGAGDRCIKVWRPSLAPLPAEMPGGRLASAASTPSRLAQRASVSSSSPEAQEELW